MAKDIHVFLKQLYEELSAIDDAIKSLEAIARRRGASHVSEPTVDAKAEREKTGQGRASLVRDAGAREQRRDQRTRREPLG